MFLPLTLRRNPQLIAAALTLHRQGKIPPDTYVLDLDTIRENGRLIKTAADRCKLQLYFMTKQLGRNPVVAQELMALGYAGAVAVDGVEAARLATAGVRLGHVGHLVQLPSHQVADIVAQRPEVITVYTVEKAAEISRAAGRQGCRQKLLLRVWRPGDVSYPGQQGGFALADLLTAARNIAALPHVEIHGLTAFPCLTFDESGQRLLPTANVTTLHLARRLLATELGIVAGQMNMPSATCVASLPLLAELGATHGEPGHGLTGTTPLHAVADQPERPALVYVSEISHYDGDTSYCFGGGHYRRSHMTTALVGDRPDNLTAVAAERPDDNSIDYHIGLNGRRAVGETVIFAFRAQIFVTRSQVAVVSGIQSGQPRLRGLYDSQGRLLSAGADE